ncbi:MAG: peptide ABC transporter substrate-binding protein [Microcoleaceae cyanobacterium]
MNLINLCKPQFFIQFILFINFLGLTACNSAVNQSTDSLQTSQNTLRLLYWQAPTILNPHLSSGFKDSEASRITLEPLASFNANGELIPFLAAEIPTIENGAVAADGKSVTWKLKQGIKWSDGTPFTADDVVFTHQFLTNPDVGAATAGTYQVIEKVEKLDDYTVKIQFKQVTPAWFLVFVGTEGMILPRHIFQDYNGINSRQAPANLMPVGTGAYRVVEFKPGDVVIYEPNPHFRSTETPHFQQIQLKGGGDATSAARAILQTEDADFAYNLQVEANVLNRLEAVGKGRLISNFGALMERVLINQTDPNRATNEGEKSSLEFPHPFFSDPQVRQAFSLAIDRETIANQLYGATGKPTANFIVAPQQYVSDNTEFEFNLEQAAALLDQAGWEDSNNNGIRDKDGVEMNVLFQTSVNPLRQKTQEVIKQSLESIGIQVELKSIDPSVYFSGDPGNSETVERFQADLQMYTTGNTNPDPGSYLKTYTCDEVPQKSNNWIGDNPSRYCNPEYDQLWQQSNTEIDPEKRTQMIIEMNNLLVQNQIVIPLIHRAEVAGVSNTITGVELTPWDLNTWKIQDWKRQE